MFASENFLIEAFFFFQKPRLRRAFRVTFSPCPPLLSYAVAQNLSGLHCLPLVQLFSSFQVPVNPSESRPPGKAPALSLAPESFSVQSSGQTHSYTLIVRVYSDQGGEVIKTTADSLVFGFHGIRIR